MSQFHEENCVILFVASSVPPLSVADRIFHPLRHKILLCNLSEVHGRVYAESILMLHFASNTRFQNPAIAPGSRHLSSQVGENS